MTQKCKALDCPNRNTELAIGKSDICLACMRRRTDALEARLQRAIEETKKIADELVYYKACLEEKL